MFNSTQVTSLVIITKRRMVVRFVVIFILVWLQLTSIVYGQDIPACVDATTALATDAACQEAYNTISKASADSSDVCDGRCRDLVNDVLDTCDVVCNDCI